MQHEGERACRIRRCGPEAAGDFIAVGSMDLISIPGPGLKVSESEHMAMGRLRLFGPEG
jgi:hypothetical protein